MSEVKLAGQPRTEFGKGAARRLRRTHQVPAVLYGHGTAPVHISLPGHETMMALKVANALLSIEIDGSSTLALPKDVQRDPIKGFIEHVDLLIVRRGEKVTVEVPLHVVGDPVPGALITAELSSLSVEVEATSIPEAIEVDIAGVEIGTQIHAAQIPLPRGASLAIDPETIAVLVSDATRSSDTSAEATPEPVEA